MKLLSFLAGAAHAQEWDQTPPELVLDAQERSALEAGEMVVRQGHEDRGSMGTAMVLVDGTVEESWAAILDFDNYVRFLPYITASWSESTDRSAPDNALRWGVELTTKGVVTRYRVDCLMHSEQGYMAWEMRPVGYSPLAASHGWWRVESWADDPSKTLMIYQVRVETAWWLPERVHRLAADQGLGTMVSQMRRQVAFRREG